MSKFFHLIYSLLLPLAMVCAIACSSDMPDKKIVTVSIEPQKYLVEQIAGDRVQVRCLLADGANPETYDPSMTHMLNLQKSAVYLRVGNIGFEAALVDKIHDSNPGLPIFDTSEGITPIRGTHTHGHGHEDEDTPDPHTWTSVKNARIMAGNILKALTEVDPDHATEYSNNYARLTARLDSIDSEYSRRLAPLSGRAFLVWHPSLSYFARDYGLRQIVVGGAESKESSIEELRSAMDQAGERGADVFFSQTDLDSRLVSALNDELGARKVTVNLLSSDWEGEMNRIVDALTANQ